MLLEVGLALSEMIAPHLPFLTRSILLDSPQIENAFVGEYPKLLRLFNELLKRLRPNYEAKRSGEQIW